MYSHSVRGKTRNFHSQGFTIKAKYEKNTDSKEGKCSERTNKEFIECSFSTVHTLERRLAMHQYIPNDKRSRLLEGQWTAKSRKSEAEPGFLGEHNYIATKDIKIHPAAHKGTPSKKCLCLI